MEPITYRSVSFKKDKENLMKLISLLMLGYLIMTAQSYEKATFAGGCFWCMEQPFEQLEGVISVVSGFTGGTEENPEYNDVASGNTSHCEAVLVTYDPSIITYSDLLKTFWMNINPVQEDGQFYDRGPQYRTEIFFHNQSQKDLAEKSKKELDSSGKFNSPIVTNITIATDFYPADEYHQDYYKKNSFNYLRYKNGSGRTAYIKKTWGK